MNSQSLGWHVSFAIFVAKHLCVHVLSLVSQFDELTVNPIELVIQLSQFDELTVAWLACFICYFCGSGWRTLKKVVAHLVISVH
jgi:hypothetical protein